MPGSCLLYYITDRTAFGPDEATRQRRLLEKIAEATRAGVNYIQLRERDLNTRDLEYLTREAVRIIQARRLAIGHWPPTTALLINSRTDVALAAQADGVHLRSEDISPAEVRAIWKKYEAGQCGAGKRGAGICGAGTPARQISPRSPLIAVSCHSPAEVTQAAASAATFAVFAPVFEKKDAPATQAKGLAQLHKACQADIPVLALGGVTLANANSCLAAGAAGIAAIRLFQESDIAETVDSLHHSCG